MAEIIFWIVNWIINRRSFDKCQILLIIIIILLCKIISDIQDQNHQQQNRVTQQFEQSSVDQIGKFIISGLLPVCFKHVTGDAVNKLRVELVMVNLIRRVLFYRWFILLMIFYRWWNDKITEIGINHQVRVRVFNYLN